MGKCNICKRELDQPNDPTTQNCGGDCLQCMADCGDPDSKSRIKRLNIQNGRPMMEGIEDD